MPNMIVCLKQALDVAKIKVDAATNKPVLAGVPNKASDFDKNALEEAVKIKEKLGGKITVLCAGAENAKEQIKEALAAGGDEAILVKVPEMDKMDYLSIANILAAAVKKAGEFDLILCGEYSIDWYSSQMGPRLAELLQIPQATYVKETAAEAGKIVVKKDEGDEELEIELSYPALVSVSGSINQPRLPNLMQIMAAGTKPINEMDVASLAGDCGQWGGAEPKVTLAEVSGITTERKNIMIEDADPAVAVQKLGSELEGAGIKLR